MQQPTEKVTLVVGASGATGQPPAARFVADLIKDDDTWTQWQGRIPVIYNRAWA